MICFRLVGEHETDQEGRARPAEAFQQYAEQTHDEQRDQVAEIALRLERRETDHHDHVRRQIGVADRRQHRDVFRQEQTGTRPEHIGQRERPDDDVGQIELPADHGRAGLKADQHHPADKHGHRPRPGNAEQKRRDQTAAFLGVVGAFRRKHAADVALAELRRVLNRLLYVAVGDPVDDAAAEAR